MNDLQDCLMDELYFVISYNDLVQTIDWNNELEDTLKELLDLGYVQQMVYDKNSGDFIKVKKPSTQLKGFSYLATKKGLLAHSGF